MPTPQKEPLYIDSWTQEAFNKTGKGDYITQEELAHFGQVFRSHIGCQIFETLTDIHLSSLEDIKKVFIIAKQGKLNLSEILQSPSLKKYKERTKPYAYD